ncbi:MAG TPA: type I polyketide synthase, partial [Herpetosiphonaceae bacterium]
MDSPTAQIEAWILGHLADRLGLEPAEIDPHRPFAEYGLASLEGVNLVKELAGLLGRELPLTLAWEQPTAAALAAHLANEAPAAPRISAGQQPAPEGAVAIIGMGARFPGAPGLRAFWELLSAGGDAITEVPPERWPLDQFYDPDPTQPGKLASRWGGFVAGIDQFDAEFFGLPDHEAAHLDPRQRLICETAWEALEDAGIPPLSLAGSSTGVFVSTLSANYGSIIFNYYPETVRAATGTGNGDSVIANRLSYLLDLRGPSMAINTACSGALVALHLACQSLRAGESQLALAGGVNLLLKPDDTIFFTKTGALSPDGRCKVFDRAANGIVRSDGAGVVVLKPLE